MLQPYALRTSNLSASETFTLQGPLDPSLDRSRLVTTVEKEALVARVNCAAPEMHLTNQLLKQPKFCHDKPQSESAGKGGKETDFS